MYKFCISVVDCVRVVSLNMLDIQRDDRFMAKPKKLMEMRLMHNTVKY